MEFSAKNDRPLVIIAEDIDSEPLSALIINRLKGTLKLCCVKTPGFGNNRKSQLEDMAILTQSQVVDTEIGMSFDNVDTSILGSAKKIIIGKDDTVIIDGAGDK